MTGTNWHQFDRAGNSLPVLWYNGIMLSSKEGRKLNTYVSDYVVFDLETTGVSPIKDDVIEISAVKVLGGEVADEFSMLVNPGRPIPYYASAVNGINDDMVADAPGFEEALGAFLEFAGDSILVGHNIHTFDMKFICRDAKRYFGQTVGNDYIDTLPLARMYLPKLAHHTLSDLAMYYDIDASGAHRALADCRMNQIIFERLGEEMRNPSEDVKKCPKCPVCGSVMKLRNGRFGEFWGCSAFPECRYTRDK